MTVCICREKDRPGLQYWWDDVMTYNDMLELIVRTAQLLKINKLPPSWIRRFGENIIKDIGSVLAKYGSPGEYFWVETKKNFKRIKPEDAQTELVRFEKRGSETGFEGQQGIEKMHSLILLQEVAEIIAANSASYFITAGDVSREEAGKHIDRYIDDVLKG